MQETRLEITTLIKQASVKDVELSQAKNRIRELEKQVHVLSLAKTEERRKRLSDGLSPTDFSHRYRSIVPSRFVGGIDCWST